MRLTTKIVCFVLLGVIVLLAIDAFLSAQREIHLFENDMKHDAHLLGRSIKEMITDVWRTNGQSEAMDLLRRVNEDENVIRIRWVWFDVPQDNPHAPRVSQGRLDPVLQGREICLRDVDEEGNDYLYTYVPVKVDDERKGAVELSESPSEKVDFTRNTVMRSIVLAAVMLLSSGLTLVLVGTRMVGRPLDRLTEKARRIGAGDLSADLVLGGRDELSVLAMAMNQMCRQLAAAHEAMRVETEARISALEQLRHTERLATLGQLSSGMAHELGTPLNVIAGRAKLVSTEDLDKTEIIHCSNIIITQADRMTKIIRQLLDFARRREPQKKPANIQNLATRVLETLDPIARKQGVSLKFTRNIDATILSIDESQFQQVLMNIVMNGVQAMPNGGQLEVGLQSTRAHASTKDGGPEREYLSLYVKDEGKGISEKNLPHIFDPFFTTKEVGEGTGLGLSIAYGIVKEHDGWIDVESEVGRGTCFTIYLPANGSEIPDET